MIQKKTKETSRTVPEENRIIRETIRKSRLNASGEFAFRKLARHQEGFLDCSLEEEKESLSVAYEVGNRLPWADIRREKKELLFAALIDAGKLEEKAKIYRFTLAPENLYYDIQGRVYVKERDVYGADETFREEEFLREYRSLIGSTLSKKYRFEDYDQGGQDLLAEDKFLGGLLECTDAEQITDRLYGEYARYREIRRERFAEVSKAKNRALKIALAATGALTLAGAVFAVWLFAWERPYKEAVIAANEAYLQSDYSGTVEAMRDVEVERMDACQKYILSYACVRCESFSADNMQNILNTITLNGDEKAMEYWIHINRLDTEKAADIAMQVSNDQLLFYAYLKERAVVENDSALTGQEKNERLSALENKLKPLEEEFSTQIKE